MTVALFTPFFGGAYLLMILATLLFVFTTKKWIAHSLFSAAILSMSIFIALVWIHIGYPPMRTLGDTRMWYAFFLPTIGYITFIRKKYNWFLVYSLGMTLIFLLLNILKPENFSKELAPALQSAWFAPHVIVYILGYALLAASALVGAFSLYTMYFKTFRNELINLADNFVYIGLAFVTFGLLFGAFWAKQAWGHYWTWDPKETWAFLTWLIYLIYIHLRISAPTKLKTSLWILSLAFVILLLAWFGLNILPSAQNSVHIYSN
jgi:ABC-type transport system involved in cytochrome c biogenesis permease subunit